MRTLLRYAIATSALGVVAGASLGAYWLGYSDGMHNQSSQTFLPMAPPSSAENVPTYPLAGKPLGELSSVTRSTVPFHERQ